MPFVSLAFATSTFTARLGCAPEGAVVVVVVVVPVDGVLVVVLVGELVVVDVLLAADVGACRPAPRSTRYAPRPTATARTASAFSGDHEGEGGDPPVPRVPRPAGPGPRGVVTGSACQ